MFRTLLALTFFFGISQQALAQDASPPPMLDHIVVKASVKASVLEPGANDRKEVGKFKDQRAKPIAIACKRSGQLLDCVLIGAKKEHPVTVKKGDAKDVLILNYGDKTSKALRIKEIHLHFPGIHE
jgi:hypothetical protein